MEVPPSALPDDSGAVSQTNPDNPGAVPVRAGTRHLTGEEQAAQALEAHQCLLLTSLESTLKNLARNIPIPTADPETLEQFVDLGKATLLQRTRNIQIRVEPGAPPDTFIVSSNFMAQIAETARKTLIDRVAQTRFAVAEESHPRNAATGPRQNRSDPPDETQKATTEIYGRHSDPGPPGTIQNPHRYPYDTVPDMPPVEGDIMAVAKAYAHCHPLVMQTAKTWAWEQRTLRLNTMFFPPKGSEQNVWYHGITELFTQTRYVEIANVFMHIRMARCAYGASIPKDWRIEGTGRPRDSLAVLQAFTRQRRSLRNASKATLRIYISHTGDWTESQQAWLCHILSKLEQVEMIYLPEHLTWATRPGTTHPELEWYNKLTIGHVSTLRQLSNIVIANVPEIFWPRMTLLHVGGDGPHDVKWSLDELKPATPGDTRECQVMCRGFCDKNPTQHDRLWLGISQLPAAVRTSITHWSVESHDEVAARDTDAEHTFIQTLLQNLPSVRRYDHTLEHEEFRDVKHPRPFLEGRCAQQEAKRIAEKLRRILEARNRLLLQTDPFLITSMTSTVTFRQASDSTCHWCLPYRMEEILHAQFANYPFTRVEKPQQGEETISQIFRYIPHRRVTAWRFTIHPRHGRCLEAKLSIATRGGVCSDKRHAEVVKTTDPEEWRRWCEKHEQPEQDNMRAGPSRHSYSRTQAQLMSSRGGMRPRKK